MLKIEDLDLDMIATAMQDDGSMGLSYYLNVETGEVVTTGFDDDEAEVDPEELENEKYEVIAHLESYESYQHMEDFAVSLPEGRARTVLEQALIRSRPFRHFKDALGDYPDERQAWFEFKDAAMAKVITRWLVDIDAIEDLDAAADETAE